TSGHALPGVSAGGDYSVIAAATPPVFVTGRLSGPPAIVTVDGSPFVFETNGANANFLIPVAAGQAFTIKYLDKSSGSIVGTSSGQAPSSGSVDLGLPRSEEHTSELQSRENLVCRLLLEKK